MFFDLKCLPDRVEEAVQRVVEQIQSAASSCFDTAALSKAAAPAGPGPNAAATNTTKKPGAPKGNYHSTTRATLLSFIVVLLMEWLVCLVFELNPAVGGQPPLGSEGAWKTTLWSRIDALLERLYRGAIQIWNLQRVLCKKRDALSHTRLIDVVLESPLFASHVVAAGGGDDTEGGSIARRRSSVVEPTLPGSEPVTTAAATLLYDRFWALATAKIRSQIALAVSGSPFIKGCLVDGYPKLRNLLLSTCSRLQVMIQLLRV